MPTTSYTDFTAAARGITGRTNATGGAVTDYTAEEDRLVNAIVNEGAVTANAFKVAASAGMVLTVGSGAAKADLYAVAGDASGQSNYLIRLETATVNVTVPASDPSQSRTDEIYLIVLDSPYDSNTLGTASAPLSLPRIGYRKGDAGGAAPGPDATWKASVKLATITVDPTVTTIVAGKIADNRVSATLALSAPATKSVRVNLTSALSLVTGTNTTVSFTTEDFDTDNFHDTITNPSRLTVPAGLGGKYVITAAAFFGPGSAGSGWAQSVQAKLNGTTVLALATTPAGQSSYGCSAHVTTVETLAAGDYIEMIASQQSGANLNLTAGRANTYLTMTRLGD